MHFDAVLKKCASLSHVKQLHSHLLTTGLFLSNPAARARILDLCAASTFGDLHLASLIFQHTPYPSTNDFNALIRGTALSPHPLRSLHWYVAALRTSPRGVDALSCSFALKACARALARAEAAQLHSHALGFGFYADVLLLTTLLDGYAKMGDLDAAWKVFDEMPRRDIASWNALITGLAQGSQPHEAVALFKRMTDEGLKPNEVSVLGALSACSQLGAVGEGERVHEYIRNENLDAHVQVCNVVIDMYSKCGFVDRAFEVFNSMPCRKELVTWNTMIMGFAMQGDGYKAIELFKQMGQGGAKPDAVSYLAVLCACNHAGLVDEGLRLFYSISDSGLVPNVKHYGTIVDLLGRAGRIQEAYDIIVSMPMMPDTVLWQSLLGACKTYGNVEMAEIASRYLVEMGSKSCGDFVLLSNIYAARARWNDVGRVREAMKDQDVKKIPGFSYIEVGGLIHKFNNGDQRHENYREIYRKLDEIKAKVGEYGCVAGTDFVLHDIGQEEKENAIYYHSEKLAVAFGLISVPEGNPIRVIKNLRICGDCHAVIKLVSKIYNREIIVRDRTRFHRFSAGSCSCRDYW
ncbi:pentatricopeptide repeat-containing protein At1g34160 [Punica granatum]|uniref:Pentatricopeptide repeat-containing protein At1g34160 n=1 Tax=Punica granatum TaxID=22663 RepID=A0A218XIT8_PUNGR|nr:pentatricopeptide repeat-containing protein At1g34160 [Punica granatum]XP_031394354.1 pentatricopeptide repeat-containing protein At1g34160 [Punica granatum]XP_031394355.1 pentatricopeptide repeat-containing protein At1g34160 [Punica granatum]OWM84636.1 hypothetical protein CDL15_Pgr027423 [Punica granatum]